MTTIDNFKKTLAKADAITVDDSPLLTSWDLDEYYLISTRWNEDDSTYEFELDEENIHKILYGEDKQFHIYEQDCVTRVQLYKIEVL